MAHHHLSELSANSRMCRAAERIRPVATIVLICLGLFLPGGHVEADDRAGSRPSDVQRPIVLVPGITGTSLRDRDSGNVEWGDGNSLLTPRDSGHGLALPVSPRTTPPRLEPFSVIEQIRLLGIFRRDIYGPIIKAFEEHGYHRGRLSDPAIDQSFFTFAYDWRQSNEQAVRLLYDQLENLRRLRQEERLEVALICQSNGAHICRYLAKYGKTPLADVERGLGHPPEQFDIRQIVLIGTSNGGSLRILRELDRGRRYVPVIGRRMRPETLFTFPTLYQDLPSYSRDIFVDETGKALDLDLYDAEVWKDHGFSIFGAKAARRLSRSPLGRVFGTEKQRLEFLATTLKEARRLQDVLTRDVEDFGKIRYDLIQNRAEPTPERAVLIEDGDGSAGQRWRLLFTGDKDVDENLRLSGIVTALGDGHATVASQNWLSPQEKALIPCETFDVEGSHFSIILNPATIGRLVELLSSEDGNVGCGDG